jgi:DNA-directed RNA polymerase delta subunit
MGYKDLVEQVIYIKGVHPGQNLAKVKAKIHTEISVDGRFKSQPGGLWGLREWVVKPPPYKVIEPHTGDKPKLVERLRKELETEIADEVFEVSDVADDLVLDDGDEEEDEELIIEEPEEPEEE